MTVTIQAVYAGGVFHPIQPLALADGETVELTISSTSPPGPSLRPMTPEEEDYVRRVKATGSLEELLAVIETAPPLPEGYDLTQALNENRRATGERLLFPENPEGSEP
jgi:predicted DNA-binding antitoxin AbrB/MazE fold protein